MRKYSLEWNSNTDIMHQKLHKKIDRRAQLKRRTEKLSTREARIKLAYENEVDTLEEIQKKIKKRLKAVRIDWNSN